MQEKDFNWFLENYDSLYKEYGCAYLAIKNSKVLGVYKSYADGIRSTQKTEELGSFIVQLCDGTESAYTNRITSMNFVIA